MGNGFSTVYGHARPGKSQALNVKIGAVLLDTFHNWYGTGEHLEAALKEARAAWDEVTARSMWNLVIARQSLKELAKPVKASPNEETRKTPRVRPRSK
jgi:hypothetical protein